MTGESTVTLSLISHTNVGKTTLARTLLRKDIGEVQDQPHVTDISSVFTLLQAEDGTTLRLWDTPGFGDTARLLKRLRNADNPVGWLLGQVWDRFADRPLWCSQQAARNVQGEADLVLYLVNVAENPADAGYVALEMQILSWIGIPVLVLLNQSGPPRERRLEKLDEESWRDHLKDVAVVKEVLSLDAFARCWVQEGLLLESVGKDLSSEKTRPFASLAKVWRKQNMDRFRKSMSRLASQLAHAASDRELLAKTGLTDKLKRLILFSGAGERPSLSGKETAMALLAQRLDENIRSALDDLIALHELEGNAADTILRRLHDDYAMSRPVNEGISALLGGMVSGALLGLGADLAAGGLTFGGGALVGGILGAAGAGGLAKGFNLVRGESAPSVRWSDEFFEGLVRSALLRYLAVAHYGRGRGNYSEGEHPKFWQAKVSQSVETRRVTVKAIWDSGKSETSSAKLAKDIEPLLVSCALELLSDLYPEAKKLFR